MERLKRKRVSFVVPLKIIPIFQDEDEKQRLGAVLEQFKDDFESTKIAHINTSFVRGEVVNADKPCKSFIRFKLEFLADPKSDIMPIFTPPPIKKSISAEEARRLASEVGRKIMLEAQQKKVATAIQTGTAPVASVANKPALSTSRPPKPGSKKDVQKTKLTNLEQFKQELKQ
jgi:hypothetical protein